MITESRGSRPRRAGSGRASHEGKIMEQRTDRQDRATPGSLATASPQPGTESKPDPFEVTPDAKPDPFEVKPKEEPDPFEVKPEEEPDPFEV
jgi:hypothetical protein